MKSYFLFYVTRRVSFVTRRVFFMTHCVSFVTHCVTNFDWASENLKNTIESILWKQWVYFTACIFSILNLDKGITACPLNYQLYLFNRNSCSSFATRDVHLLWSHLSKLQQIYFEQTRDLLTDFLNKIKVSQNHNMTRAYLNINSNTHILILLFSFS